MENSVNSRVVALLKTLNLDENELARRIGKHPSTIYRIVNNESEPTKTTIKLIADELNVSYDYLLTGKGTSQKEAFTWREEAYESIKKQLEYLQNQNNLLLTSLLRTS